MTEWATLSQCIADPTETRGMMWDQFFEIAQTKPPATDADIVFLHDEALAPLSEREVTVIRKSQRNPFPKSDPLHATFRPFDPTAWELPRRTFPESFEQFLRWSNGGSFVRGDREYGVFSPREVREYLLAYHVPQYLPNAVPFAFDGGGGFYLFDMRTDPEAGEYPVIHAHSGNLRWSDAENVATSFPMLFTDRERS